MIDLLLQEINNSQTMIINVHNECMKLVMIENVYGKFHKIMICKNTWKFVRIWKFEWWKLLIEEGNLNLKILHNFIMSQIPFHSCLLIWKDAMQPWMNTIWNMSKNQKKFCTGSLGTGSDTGRTRFLVNVTTRNSKFSRRNRFPYRDNPVPGTKTRKVIFE